MPKVQEIYALCNQISPFELQETWDNSGLNLGDMQNEVEKIYLTLEVDCSIAHAIAPHSLLITHHPLIFSPLKALNLQTYPSNILSILLKKDCALIAMHTNFDHTHLNPYFARDILGFKDVQPFLYGLSQNIHLSFEALCEHVEQRMQLSNYKFLKAASTLLEVYICCGSGASLISSLPPQSCLITSDIKHHDAMLAQSLGVSLIDVGHYESEKYFSEILYKDLKNFGYEAIISPLKNPLEFSKPKDR